MAFCWPPLRFACVAPGCHLLTSAQLGAEIYGPKALWNGFRTPGLIRFVPGEEFYLSNTHGGPRM